MITRREFGTRLAALTSVAAAAWTSRAETPPFESDLRLFARQVPITFGAGETRSIAAWTINGECPGPLLTLQRGVARAVRVVNDLDETTSMHWHGLRLPNAMDGVAGVTQPSISARGGTFAYELNAPDAGTFWYHSHLAGLRQQGFGLVGPLVVRSPDEPEMHADHILLAQDWFLNKQLDAPSAEFHDGLVSDAALRRGYRFAVRSYGGARIAAQHGKATRVRCINAAGFAPYRYRVVGADAWCIAYDGLALERPERCPDEGIDLYSGQRVDLAIVPRADTREAYVAVASDYAPYYGYGTAEGTRFPIDVSGAQTAAPDVQSLVLPRHGLAPADLRSAQVEKIVVAKTYLTRWNRIAYDARAAFTGVEDKRRYFWTFNGRLLGDESEAEICSTSKNYPLLVLRLGRSYILRIVNSQDEWHPFHLHGHAFQEVARNERPVTTPVWRDTTFVPAGESVDIAFVADNPGNWMFHCHTTGHQMQGMTGIIRVET
jgi:FtsP/CotA-like multicopper oxidase with cupredoxin domain